MKCDRSLIWPWFYGDICVWFKGNNFKFPCGIWLVIKHRRDILDRNIFSKSGEVWMKTVLLREWPPIWLDSSTAKNFSYFIQRSLAGLFKSPNAITFFSKKSSFKSHESKVPNGIWLVIKLGQDILDILFDLESRQE